MTDPLANLNGMMRPHTVRMTPETLAERRELVVAVAARGDLDATTLVTLAHGQRTPEAEGAEQPLDAAISEHDPSLDLDGDGSFQTVVASAALAVRLGDDGRTDLALHGLLVESARFLELTSPNDMLPTLAAEALARSNRRTRGRLEVQDAASQIRAQLNKIKMPAEETATESDLPTIVAAVNARDAALRSVAQRVEELIGLTESRLALLEEELDLLWWSQRGTTLAGDAWEGLEPAKRAAVAAREIADLLVRIPAPPRVSSLLRSAVGVDANSTTSIADVAQALPGTPGIRQLLLPLMTYASIAHDLGAEEKEATGRQFVRYVPVIEAPSARPLIDLAEQVLREQQIMSLS